LIGLTLTVSYSLSSQVVNKNLFILSLIDFVHCRLLKWAITVGGMASKGLRANHLSSYRKADAGYCASHTDETLIGYTACCVAFLFISPYLYSSHILSFLNTDFSNIHSKLNPAFSSTLCEALLKSKTPV
jgi:hypothetical protein